MRIKTALLLAIVAPCLARAQQTANSSIAPQDVAAAIERGVSSKKWEGLQVRQSRLNVLASEGFEVLLEGPLNRIAIAAGRAASKYLPYTLDSIAPGMLDASITITATPRRQVTMTKGSTQVVTPPATHMVLAVEADGKTTIIQPLKTELFDVEVIGVKEADAPVPKFTTKGIRALFPMTPELAGAFAVRVITDKKEFELKVDAKSRGMVR